MQKTGWSNDNILQANYQRLFHHGVAYQISYSWSKPMRDGGNGSRDGQVNSASNYNISGLGVVSPYNAVSTNTGGPLIGATSYPVIAPATPPPAPANTPSWQFYRALGRFANYMVDTSVPKQHIQFNGIVDLPFGRSKRLLGNSNRFVNELVGGYQIAGSGGVASQDFTVTSTHWGPANPLHVYKHKIPITDCRSGNCYKEYLWFNGYIAPTAISGNACSAGLSTVVSSLPANYTPYQGPSDQGCGAPVMVKGVLTATTEKQYGSDYVNMTLLDGSTSPVSYQPYPTANTASGVGSNPFSHTVLNGPMNWNADLSLFKVFPIAGKMNLRFNMDAFNAFNHQGYNNPSGSDGTEAIEPGGASGATSYNTPRQIQFTLRLSF